jgi:flagellar M-ring protein FliF
MSDLALPAGNARQSLALTEQGRSMGTMLDRVRAFTDQPAIAKSLPAIGLLALLGLAAIIWMAVSEPPQRNLFQGLADGDKASVADTLKGAGIAYAIDRDTGALSVAEGDFYQAKMLLAQQGLPKSAPDGDALISSLPMGASRAVEGERLRGAHELDLARTIEAIDAVESAKVHLAVEQPSVFLRDRSEPGASVMLRLRSGRALSDSQVQAIVHLVASSVPGLAPDGVSVVDQTGRLLSRSGGDAATGASERQIEIQSRIEARYTQALTKLLTPLVGPGNFTAEVHADLDFAEVQATRETFPKDTAVVREEQGGWTNDSASGAGEAGGIPGALSNQAPAAAQVATTAAGPATAEAPAAAVKTSETFNRTFELGREVSVTRQPIGTVKRLSVAVALREGSKRLSKLELATLENLVKGAVGYDEARGDLIALSARSFAPVDDDATAPKWWEASWVSMLARNLSAMVIVALLVFGIGKPLLKRSAAKAAERSRAKPAVKARIGGEIAAALANEARNDPGRPVTLDMIEAAPGYANRAALIRNFVRQDPDRAALVVRDLIRTDMPGGEGRDG